jgi:hypothetical protein
VELDRRLRAQGVLAAAVDPGEITTGLGRHLDEQTTSVLAERLGGRPMVYKSVEAGVVADAGAVGERYCENCTVAEITTDPASTTGVFSYALDGDHAQALWTVSERLVGERFR